MSSIFRGLTAALFLLLLVHPARAQSLGPLPADMTALHDRLAPLPSAPAREWITQEVTKAVQTPRITEANIRADIQTRFTGQGLSNIDMNIMEFVVVTEVANGLMDDITTQITDIQKKNAPKNPPPPSPDGNVNITLTGEQAQALGAVVQRRAKFIETLGVLLKKIGNSQGDAIKTLK